MYIYIYIYIYIYGSINYFDKKKSEKKIFKIISPEHVLKFIVK